MELSRFRSHVPMKSYSLGRGDVFACNWIKRTGYKGKILHSTSFFWWNVIRLTANCTCCILYILLYTKNTNHETKIQFSALLGTLRQVMITAVCELQLQWHWQSNRYHTPQLNWGQFVRAKLSISDDQFISRSIITWLMIKDQSYQTICIMRWILQISPKT